MIQKASVAGIAAGSVIGALLLLTSMVAMVVSVTIYFSLKKPKKETFNLTHNPAYIMDELARRKVATDVNAAYDHLRTLERDVGFHRYQDGDNERHQNVTALNMNNNVAYTPPFLLSDISRIFTYQLQDPSRDENNYESIT